MQEDNIITLKDGRRLGYAEYGDPKGKPLFYFHGWPSSRLGAISFNKAAKRQRVRIIALDRPGYGLSDYKKDRTLLEWSDDVVEVTKQLHIKKFSVVGVSGGAPYAAACAYKMPNRLIKTGIVVGLAPTTIEGVLEGLPPLSKFAWRFYSKFPITAALASIEQLLEARKFFPTIITYSFRAKADQEILGNKTIRDQLAENKKEAFRQGKMGPLLDLFLYTSDWGFRLQNITAKVLLWYGEDDKNVSLAMGKYYKSQIPRSILTVYPNEGHILFYRHGDEILKALR